MLNIHTQFIYREREIRTTTHSFWVHKNLLLFYIQFSVNNNELLYI